MDHFGKWLGPSNNFGSDLFYRIVKGDIEVIYISTFLYLNLKEKGIDLDKEDMRNFEK